MDNLDKPIISGDETSEKKPKLELVVDNTIGDIVDSLPSNERKWVEFLGQYKQVMGTDEWNRYHEVRESPILKDLKNHMREFVFQKRDELGVTEERQRELEPIADEYEASIQALYDRKQV